MHAGMGICRKQKACAAHRNQRRHRREHSAIARHTHRSARYAASHRRATKISAAVFSMETSNIAGHETTDEVFGVRSHRHLYTRAARSYPIDARRSGHEKLFSNDRKRQDEAWNLTLSTQSIRIAERGRGPVLGRVTMRPRWVSQLLVSGDDVTQARAVVRWRYRSWVRICYLSGITENVLRWRTAVLIAASHFLSADANSPAPIPSLAVIMAGLSMLPTGMCVAALTDGPDSPIVGKAKVKTYPVG